MISFKTQNLFIYLGGSLLFFLILSSALTTGDGDKAILTAYFCITLIFLFCRNSKILNKYKWISFLLPLFSFCVIPFVG